MNRGVDSCVFCSKDRSEIDGTTSDATVRPMFPLRCGHGICRACLPQVARSSLSSRMVPARCCTRPIPETFLRAVLDPEEFVYYSYLLRKSRSAPTRALPSTATSAAASAPPSTPDAAAAAQTPSLTPTGPTTRSKGKQKLVRKPASVRKIAVLDLVSGESGDSESEAGDSAAPVCHSCATGVSNTRARFTAPCKHVLCRNCIIARCRHAIANDEAPGGIGVPLHCCDQVLSLEFVRGAITKRDFAKYSSLFAKYEASQKAFPRKAITRGQKRISHDETVGAANETKKKLRSADASTASTSDDGGVQDCISCMEQISSAAERVKGPCGHTYCLCCFGYMAKLSLQDRARVPVRCCGVEFPEEFVKRVMPAKALVVYRKFLAEKKPGDSNLKSDKEYAALIRKIRGKQCPTCGIGVQKVSGCPTMTCALGHVFCWNCGMNVCECARLHVARALEIHMTGP